MPVKEVMMEGETALELEAPGLRLVAIYKRGPRIAFWGRPDGENLLLWPAASGNERSKWLMWEVTGYG